MNDGPLLPKRLTMITWRSKMGRKARGDESVTQLGGVTVISVNIRHL